MWPFARSFAPFSPSLFVLSISYLYIYAHVRARARLSLLQCRIAAPHRDSSLPFTIYRARHIIVKSKSQIVRGKETAVDFLHGIAERERRTVSTTTVRGFLSFYLSLVDT